MTQETEGSLLLPQGSAHSSSGGSDGCGHLVSQGHKEPQRRCLSILKELWKCGVQEGRDREGSALVCKEGGPALSDSVLTCWGFRRSLSLSCAQCPNPQTVRVDKTTGRHTYSPSSRFLHKELKLTLSAVQLAGLPPPEVLIRSVRGHPGFCVLYQFSGDADLGVCSENWQGQVSHPHYETPCYPHPTSDRNPRASSASPPSQNSPHPAPSVPLWLRTKPVVDGTSKEGPADQHPPG